MTDVNVCLIPCRKKFIPSENLEMIWLHHIVAEVNTNCPCDYNDRSAF